MGQKQGTKAKYDVNVIKISYHSCTYNQNICMLLLHHILTGTLLYHYPELKNVFPEYLTSTWGIKLTCILNLKLLIDAKVTKVQKCDNCIISVPRVNSFDNLHTYMYVVYVNGA